MLLYLALILAICRACSDNMCYNGATCDYSTQSCICRAGFEGKYCEHQINASCRSLPCMHGGVCVPLQAAGYKCECTEAWAGRRCEVTKSMCVTEMCKNGGVCKDHEYSWISCECPPGFDGNLCEEKVEVRIINDEVEDEDEDGVGVEP